MLVAQSPPARIPHSRLRSASALLAISIFAFLGCQSENGSNANQAATGAPIASFSENPVSGQPGVMVEFSDTTTGSVSSYNWDFGALGTSTEQNPTIVYPEAGTYSVSLAVSGPQGTSQVIKNDLIQVGEQPIAGFSCTPIREFVPFTVACVDESSSGTNTAWNFGDGTTATGPNPSHEYTTPGDFVIEQTVTGPGGSDQTTLPIEVIPFGIMASPSTGAAPVDVTFTAITGGQSGFVIWTIDGVGKIGTPVGHRFNRPGTYSVNLVFGDLGSALFGDTTIEYIVGHGPAAADFTPSVPGGNGPLTVTMVDNSGGEIDQWEWNFGDGTECIYPAPAVPDPRDVCNSNSPKHEYAEIESYDVTLTVTGPDADPTNPPIVSSLTVMDAVRVYILDASFELQTPNEAIEGAWTSLRPSDETEPAQHVALDEEGGADAGMPSDGKLWASLDGLGTDGTTLVDMIENGIQQVFLGPKNDIVLEFDYVLLYAEPPASVVMDAVTATVSFGGESIKIPSAQADVSSPYVGLSTRFPTRDGSDVRVTPPLTASLNLKKAFPDAPDLTFYTLTIRTSNDVNEFRSPRVYVDDIRFTAPAESPPVANFEWETDPETDSIVAGQEVFFTDTTNCPDPALVPCPCPDPAVLPCEDPTEDPTSWRWDFDTQDLTIPPTASGSGDRDPVYIFPEIGVYEVELNARLADLHDKTSLEVTVIEGPKAVFSVIDPPLPPYLAGTLLTFSSDGSTSDSTDPITAWSWDFGGWLPSDGKLDVQNPLPVTFGQVGAWVVRLTITTASGQTNTSQATITVE